MAVVVEGALREAKLQFNVLHFFNGQTRASQALSQALNCVFEEDYVRAQGICMGVWENLHYLYSISP